MAAKLTERQTGIIISFSSFRDLIWHSHPVIESSPADAPLVFPGSLPVNLEDQLAKLMKVKYPADQAVSVWIGTFPTEDDFDRSVDTDVVRPLNLKAPIESICEVSFEPQQVSLRELIKGFSGWDTFIEEAVDAAKKQGVDQANAALVCYYLKCEDAPATWGHLRFLGSFAGQDAS